jgi:hypothetical protein
MTNPPNTDHARRQTRLELEFLEDRTTPSILGTPTSFTVGAGPHSVAAGDLRGNGKLDIVTANYFGNSVSVLLGNGDGTFTGHVDYSVGSAPQAVVAADLNGDGKLDLVTANSGSATVSVLLGNGDGTFQSPVNYAVGVTPTALTVADLNGDGKPDLVVANAFSRSISVLLGTGGGAFAPAVQYPGLNFSILTGVVVGNFTGQGRLDVVTSSGNFPSLELYPGNGDATFGPARATFYGTNFTSLVAGDFNGDGKLDVVAAGDIGTGGTIHSLLGNGNGTFEPKVFDFGTHPMALATGDLTGDGKLDIVTANSRDDSISVLPGLGDGGFAFPTTIPVGKSPSSVAVGDFNNDGRPDVVVVNSGNNSVSVLLNIAGTTTTLSSSAPSSGLGQNVTFTATVKADTPTSGTPTGAVTFRTAAGTLQTVSLTNGSASFTTSSLPIGQTAVTAVYSGGNGFTAGLTQVVHDGPSTPGMFDSSTGTWYLRNSAIPGAPDFTPFPYGGVGWNPLVGDWEVKRDGQVSVGVVDPMGSWYLRNSNSPGAPDEQFALVWAGGIVGSAPALPLFGDWTGTSGGSPGLFDTRTASWTLQVQFPGGLETTTPFVYGLPGWIPVVGDWNGDGKTSIGIFDPSTATWYLRNENSAGAPDFTPFVYGLPGWKPVVGDWNGAGKTTIGVVDPAGNWYLRNTNSAGPPDIGPFPYGLGSWTPVAGHYRPLQPPSGKGGPQVNAVDVPSLTPNEVQVEESLSLLSGAGIAPTVGNHLTAAPYEVAPLPGASLDLADVANQHDLLNSNAAGNRWFVSSIPASTTPVPSDKLDLLTVLLHERGHRTGRDDLDPGSHPGELMDDMLPPGVRQVESLDLMFGSLT